MMINKLLITGIVMLVLGLPFMVVADIFLSNENIELSRVQKTALDEKGISNITVSYECEGNLCMVSLNGNGLRRENWKTINREGMTEQEFLDYLDLIVQRDLESIADVHIARNEEKVLVSGEVNYTVTEVSL